MKSLLARCVSKYWFCLALPWVGSAVGSVGGYLMADQINPLLLLIVLALMGLYSNRFAFGTLESYLFISLWMIVAVLLYSIKPTVSVAAAGFISGQIIAWAAIGWMDKPNQLEATRQALLKQRH